MLKKRVFPFYRALPLGLLLCFLVGVTPVWGQLRAQPLKSSYDVLDAASSDDDEGMLVDKGLRIGPVVGYCFSSEEERTCPIYGFDIQLYRAPIHESSSHQSGFSHLQAGSLQRRRQNGSPLSFRFSGMNTLEDTWPDREEDEENGTNSLFEASSKSGGIRDSVEAEPELDHGGTLSGIFEFVLPIVVEHGILIEPFLGGGMSYVRRGNNEMPNVSALAPNWVPVLSYGLSFATVGRSGIGLRLQFRTFVFFPNNLEYIAPEGNRFRIDDISVIKRTSLIVGVNFEL